MSHIPKPVRGEVADYYFTYVDKVQEGDIRQILTAQAREAATFLESIPESRTHYRYAPDKWTIREVVGHLNDTERVFAFRAFWFARGFDTPLPSFDQDVADKAANSEARGWQSHLDEFRAVRSATIALFDSMPEDGWRRTGVASGNPFTVSGLAYITAGHVAHHLDIVRERYL